MSYPTSPAYRSPPPSFNNPYGGNYSNNPTVPGMPLNFNPNPISYPGSGYTAPITMPASHPPISMPPSMGSSGSSFNSSAYGGNSNPYSVTPGNTPSWVSNPSPPTNFSSYNPSNNTSFSPPSLPAFNPLPISYPSSFAGATMPPSSFSGTLFPQHFPSLTGRVEWASPVSTGFRGTLPSGNQELTPWTPHTPSRTSFPFETLVILPKNTSFHLQNRTSFPSVEKQLDLQHSMRRQLDDTMKIMYQMHASPERPFTTSQPMGATFFAIQINPHTTLFVDPVAVAECYQRASSAQQWAFQAQLAQMTSRRVEADQGERHISTMQQINTFVINALSNPRVQGSLQVLGGAAEISAGYGMTWGTGFIMAPIGHAVAVHGIDHLTTGLYCVITGKHKATATQLALQATGVPSDIAGTVDGALSMAGMGMGAKVASELVVFPQFKLPPPYLNDSYNRVGFEELKVILRAKMEKPHVVNGELKKKFEDWWRPNASIGNGSTAAAIREELATGEMVGGKFHSQKGRDMIQFLERWLQNNPNARLGDRAAAENVLKDAKNALGLIE